MNKIIISLLTIFVFVACSIKDVQKSATLYNLEDTSKITQDFKSSKILKISKIKTSDILDSDKIWYQRENFETNAYLFSRWNDNFSKLVENNIENTLFKSGIFKSVFTNYSKIDNNLILESKLIKAIQTVKGKDSFVKFEIRLFMIDKESSSLMGSRDFFFTEKCQSTNANGAIYAYNKIIKKFNKEMIQWIKILVKKS